eukprot:2455767-Amphidinium_carterae.2
MVVALNHIVHFKSPTDRRNASRLQPSSGMNTLTAYNRFDSSSNNSIVHRIGFVRCELRSEGIY